MSVNFVVFVIFTKKIVRPVGNGVSPTVYLIGSVNRIKFTCTYKFNLLVFPYYYLKLHLILLLCRIVLNPLHLLRHGCLFT